MKLDPAARYMGARYMGKLRDHGSPARVERVWERLEGSLQALEPAPHAQEGKPPRGWRRLAPAAALAASFALGVGFGGWLSSRPMGWGSDDAREPVQAEPLRAEGPREVFAAGLSARTYALPGGGELRLAPRSIVDSVTDGGGAEGGEASGARPGGLALRLVRGEATVSTRAPGGDRTTRLSLAIGQAELVTSAGSVRARLRGDRATVQVLDGSVAVASPGADGIERRVLAANQSATVTVRIRTARSDDASPAPVSTPRSVPWPSPSDPNGAPAGKAAWMVACDNADYALAYELAQKEPGGLGNVKSAEHLVCISSGAAEKKDGKAAAAAAQRVLTDHPTSQQASTAAHDLARIYRKAGHASMAKYYEQLSQDLSKGVLMSEPQLCKKVQSYAAEGKHDGVLTLSKRYQAQFPGGSCTDTIERLAAEAAKAKAKAGTPAVSAGDDPYDDEPDKADGGDKPKGDKASPPPDDDDE